MEVINVAISEDIALISIFVILKGIDVSLVQIAAALITINQEVSEVFIEQNLPLHEEGHRVECSERSTVEEVESIEPDSFSRGHISEDVGLSPVEEA